LLGHTTTVLVQGLTRLVDDGSQASVVQASFVAKIGWDRGVNATGGRVARIVSASVLIVAIQSSHWEPYARGGEGIRRIRQDTGINSASVRVVAVGVCGALRMRWAQVGGLDVSSGRVTFVGSANAVGRDGVQSFNTSLNRVARISLAHVGFTVSAAVTCLVGEHTLGSQRHIVYSQDTSVICASVSVVTVGTLGCNSADDGGRAGSSILRDDTLGRVTRVIKASGILGYRNSRSEARIGAGGSCGYALISEAHVSLVTEVGILRSVHALGSQRLSDYTQYTSVISASVSIVTVGSTSRRGTDNSSRAGSSWGSNDSHGRIARKGTACAVSGDWYSGGNTRHGWVRGSGVAGISKAHVRLVAEVDGISYEGTFGSVRFSRYCQNTDSIGTGIIIVAISRLSRYSANNGISTKSGGGVHNS